MLPVYLSLDRRASIQHARPLSRAPPFPLSRSSVPPLSRAPLVLYPPHTARLLLPFFPSSLPSLPPSLPLAPCPRVLTSVADLRILGGRKISRCSATQSIRPPFQSPRLGKGWHVNTTVTRTRTTACLSYCRTRTVYHRASCVDNALQRLPCAVAIPPRLAAF